MAHQHDHHHQSKKNLALAFFINLAFSIIEVIGGILTNSVAILSDALHDFGDAVSLGLAWYFQKVSEKKPNTRYTYGYKRYATLSALITVVILLTGSSIVLYESIGRLFHPVQTDAAGMIMLAVLGIAVNGYAMLRLRKGKSMNERAVSLHMLEDVLGWFAVLLGSILMYFFDVPIIDPILSIGVSLFMLTQVFQTLKRIFRVFMQGKPDEVQMDRLSALLKSQPGVVDVHDFHLWTMDNDLMVSSVHLVVAENTTKEMQQNLRFAAHQVLKENGVQHATIEIEFESEACEWCESV